MFQVGDIIVDAFVNDIKAPYGYTSGEKFTGEVVRVVGEHDIEVKILEGQYEGDIYKVRAKFFKKKEEENSIIRLK